MHYFSIVKGGEMQEHVGKNPRNVPLGPESRKMREAASRRQSHARLREFNGVCAGGTQHTPRHLSAL